MNTVDESELPSQAVTVFVWSSKKHVVLRYPAGRFFFLILYFIYFYFGLRWVFAAVRGLLIVVASPSAEHGLQARGPQQLWRAGSAVVARGLQSAGSAATAHGPSCSTARGILLDQGSNPHPSHWQADSQPLRHQGSPLVEDYVFSFLLF